MFQLTRFVVFTLVLLVGFKHAIGEEQATSHSSAVDLVVQTAFGPVQGELADTHPDVRVFRGIPYAAPPIGDLRWRSPEPVTPWKEIRDATEFGKECWQLPVTSEFYQIEPRPNGEDCLFLNIWTSASTSEEALPVMVWIHGGAFVMGSGSAPIYDGSSLAKDGLVIVTLNYRLGFLGFFAHPALTQETGRQGSGNQGIQDQIQALSWVRQNIAAFGGDPENVTIFGESAGAMSVCYLVASPLAKGLFQKAIGQSGGCFMKHPTLEEPGQLSQIRLSQVETEASGYSVGKQIVGLLTDGKEIADLLPFLRSLSPDDISSSLTEKEYVFPWRSIFVDGYVFPDQMRNLVRSGKGSSVSTIVGSTMDEATTLFPTLPEVTKEEWEASIQTNMPEMASGLISAYSNDADASTKTATQQMISDWFFASDVRTWAELTELLKKPTYLYVFDHAPPLPELGRSLGAFHAGEIQYIFTESGAGSSSISAAELWDESDRQVASIMRGYWTNFAKTGDPNGQGLPKWPRYEGNTDLVMGISEQPNIIEHFRKEKLDLISSFVQAEFAEPNSINRAVTE